MDRRHMCGAARLARSATTGSHAAISAFTGRDPKDDGVTPQDEQPGQAQGAGCGDEIVLADEVRDRTISAVGHA